MAQGSESVPQYTRANILLGRDDLGGAMRATARAVELAAEPESGRGARGAVGTYVLAAARMSHELGRLDDARAALRTALDKTDRMYGHQTVSFVLAAEPLGLWDHIDEFLGRVGSGSWLEMAKLVVAGEVSEAARRLDEAGHRSLGAQVRLRSQDDAELGKAIDFFRSVGATRHLTRGEEQLAAMASTGRLRSGVIPEHWRKPTAYLPTLTSYPYSSLAPDKEVEHGDQGQEHEEEHGKETGSKDPEREEAGKEGEEVAGPGRNSSGAIPNTGPAQRPPA